MTAPVCRISAVGDMLLFWEGWGGERQLGSPFAAMVREVTWFTQGHRKEVNWTPGPEVPKPEVFRGHDSLFLKTHGERRAVLFPSPRHRPGLQWAPGWKTPGLHLPSLQSSWQAGPTGAAVRVQVLCPTGNLGQKAPPRLLEQRRWGSFLPAPFSPPGG